ncbi:AraC-type DNA-binding protein [Quadrisphaera granulorum]|uniref:AraC-like DNA-binding protein n=1 Tax=Quadrisphaera granulorum TaxID=317664 RepID=A0A316A8V5_9ACTN|nr:helix-turn-helix transcriptional regulator [Quadrisphaera granulorum]PWJ54175.1 AraC-like DNA-binding protein [Quadrisphaera granulorum]SZE96314.1 AraC-type DNA-binding protein [Quadrisphaera granulorum]
MSALRAVGAAPDPPTWQLPSGPPVSRAGVCRLAQPRLQQPQTTPRFRFQAATVLLLLSGELRLGADPAQHLGMTGRETPALLLVEAGTTADLVKLPGGPEGCFRSVFLDVAPRQISALVREHPAVLAGASTGGSSDVRQVDLDDDLSAALTHVALSVADERVSDARARYRILDLLLALAERGHTFRPPGEPTTADRVRELVADAPELRWTAPQAGRALSVSEATLRRHLAREGTSFEALLLDVRMHHAVMLLQTTGWSLSHIAQACGYLSRSRFSERFRQRFGTSPVAVR